MYSLIAAILNILYLCPCGFSPICSSCALQLSLYTKNSHANNTCTRCIIYLGIGLQLYDWLQATGNKLWNESYMYTLRLYAHAHTHTCTHTHVHRYTHTHTHTQTHTHTHTFTHTCTHTHMYTDIHTHTHTHARSKCKIFWDFTQRLHYEHVKLPLKRTKVQLLFDTCCMCTYICTCTLAAMVTTLSMELAGYTYDHY